MQSVNQEGIYSKTVSATLASLARNFPARAEQFDKTHKDILKTGLDEVSSPRLVAIAPVDQAANLIISKAVQDVAKKLKMRAITTSVELDQMDTSDLQPDRDIVFLTLARDNSVTPDDIEKLYEARISKARQAALFVRNDDVSIIGNTPEGQNPLKSVVMHALWNMMKMPPNEVYMANVSSQIPEAKLEEFLSDASLKFHLKDMGVDTFGFNQSADVFIQEMTPDDHVPPSRPKP